MESTPSQISRMTAGPTINILLLATASPITNARATGGCRTPAPPLGSIRALPGGSLTLTVPVTVQLILKVKFNFKGFKVYNLISLFVLSS